LLGIFTTNYLSIYATEFQIRQFLNELEKTKLMGKLTLILGGARSGKSTYAEQIAAERGGDSVLYVATAQAFDDEMAAKIAKHRADRPAAWPTLETPQGAGAAILEYKWTGEVILLDCLTVLTSNVLLHFEDPFDVAVASAITSEIDTLLDCVDKLDAEILIVSNEVGLGLVPPTKLGRAYRDLLGRANQRLATAADEVILMVAGIPMQVK